jgi:hypothetical protein
VGCVGGVFLVCFCCVVVLVSFFVLCFILCVLLYFLWNDSSCVL